ncbi:MAG: hypothetical protein ABJB05_15930 [Parafilimonas sp.]
MKYFLFTFFLFLRLSLFSQTHNVSALAVSPLASYSSIWNDAKYSACNTAANAAYLTKSEKEVIYVLNLIRSYPALFCKTVLKKYPETSGQLYLAEDSFYFLSLVNELETMQPVNILMPDNACFISAKAHAYYSGITAYVGHERKSPDSRAKKHFYGECCEYGHSDPVDIILALLIDEGIPSLGHRIVSFTNYTKVGVSIQPHKKYGKNTVLDFYF